MLSWETRASCARKNSQGRSLEMLESSFLISLNTSSSDFRGICGGWVVSGLQGHMGLNPLHLALEVALWARELEHPHCSLSFSICETRTSPSINHA